LPSIKTFAVLPLIKKFGKTFKPVLISMLIETSGFCPATLDEIKEFE